MSERREGFCDDCKRDYETWFAASFYWNAVCRNEGQQEPMLCASCFIVRAQPIYPNSIWKVTQDGDDSDEIRWLNEKVGALNQELLRTMT